MPTEGFAPAKVNLALHVTGQRADGYHLLESIVTFADRGDVLSFTAAEADDFIVSGRFAHFVPTDAAEGDGNLVPAVVAKPLDQPLRVLGRDTGM